MFVYNRVKKCFETLLHFINSLAAAALLIIMVIVLMQVFCRVVIFRSLTWSEESSRYLMAFMVLACLATAINQDMLIRIDALDAAIKNKHAINVMNVLRSVIGLVCAVVIAVSSTRLFKIGMMQKTPAMQMPMIVMYVILFSSYVLAAISLAFKVIDCAIKVKNDAKGETK